MNVMMATLTKGVLFFLSQFVTYIFIILKRITVIENRHSLRSLNSAFDRITIIILTNDSFYNTQHAYLPHLPNCILFFLPFYAVDQTGMIHIRGCLDNKWKKDDEFCNNEQAAVCSRGYPDRNSCWKCKGDLCNKNKTYC